MNEKLKKKEEAEVKRKNEDADRIVQEAIKKDQFQDELDESLKTDQDREYIRKMQEEEHQKRVKEEAEANAIEAARKVIEDERKKEELKTGGAGYDVDELEQLIKE